MTKYIILAVVLAVLARGVGLWLPRSPVGRFFNRVYHIMAQLVKNASGGSLRLGKTIGQKVRRK